MFTKNCVLFPCRLSFCRPKRMRMSALREVVTMAKSERQRKDPISWLKRGGGGWRSNGGALCDFLMTLKNDFNVPRKSNKQKIIFCWHLEGHWRKEQDPESGSVSPWQRSADPDPYQICHVSCTLFKRVSNIPVWFSFQQIKVVTVNVDPAYTFNKPLVDSRQRSILCDHLVQFLQTLLNKSILV
jgi:hypothetical protein